MKRRETREPRFLPGSYLTDGQRLLRIVNKLSDGALCAVEDCRNLDLMLIPVAELDVLNLRPVRG
jgi:hypothetical protein